MSDGDSVSAALTSEEFARCLERLGPFEPRPLLAVAVSGGADSLALALLADRWVRRRRGRVVALTVDHRLRPESRAEAARVGRWLRARGIRHRILVWKGPYPRSDRQAAARLARYDLLESWCRDHACLHLLLAHQREDQAETFWLRLTRGSGLEGLAGMSAVLERPPCRLLRPLLDVPRARLRAYLEAQGQGWIEDPSNRNEAYARVRIRAGRALLAAEGLGDDRLAETIRHLGRARMAIEVAVAALLARAARIHPGGFVRLDRAALAATPAEVGLRALGALIASVGGAGYPPRLERIERLYAGLGALRPGGGRTLGGCRVLLEDGALLICREPALVAPPVPLSRGGPARWDGRMSARPGRADHGLALGALGALDPTLSPELRRCLGRVPPVARPALAAVRRGKRVLGIPGLGSAGWRAGGGRSPRVCFRPMRALAPLGFTVV